MGRKQKEKIVKYTAEELEKMEDRTDWKRVNSITDEELEEIVKNHVLRKRDHRL